MCAQQISIHQTRMLQGYGKNLSTESEIMGKIIIQIKPPKSYTHNSLSPNTYQIYGTTTILYFVGRLELESFN